MLFSESWTADMWRMFNGATSFNHPLNSWDVSKVTRMNSMFEDATSFNQNLNGWNVSQVSEMSAMFQGASRFRQNLCLWGERLPKDVSYQVKLYDNNGKFSGFSKLSVFEGTNCPTPAIPNMSATPPGPFCFPCKQ